MALNEKLSALWTSEATKYKHGYEVDVMTWEVVHLRGRLPYFKARRSCPLEVSMLTLQNITIELT